MKAQAIYGPLILSFNNVINDYILDDSISIYSNRSKTWHPKKKTDDNNNVKKKENNTTSSDDGTYVKS